MTLASQKWCWKIAWIATLVVPVVLALLVPSDEHDLSGLFPMLGAVVTMIAGLFVGFQANAVDDDEWILGAARPCAGVIASCFTIFAWSRGTAAGVWPCFVPTLAIVLNIVWRGSVRPSSHPVEPSRTWSWMAGAPLLVTVVLVLLARSVSSPRPFVWTAASSALLAVSLIVQLLSRLRSTTKDLASGTALRGFGNTMLTATFLAFAVLPLLDGKGWVLRPIAVVPAFLAWNVLRGRQWHVWKDAVVSRGTFFRRVLSVADIERVERANGETRLHMKSGKTVTVPHSSLDENWFAAAVEAAMAEAQRAPSLGALARNGKSVASWRQELRQRVLREGDYRVAEIDKAILHELLENPSASPEQRIGAALALNTTPNPDSRARLRVAARESANPKISRVMSKLADGEAEDAEIEEALGTEAKTSQ